MSSRQSIFRFLATALVLSLLLGYIACRAFLPFRPNIREWRMSGAWITTSGEPGYSGYFRKSFLLPAAVQNAWIAVSVCDGYEVTVNGDVIGFQSLSQPNRDFQHGVSERGQRLNNFNVAPGVNDQRDYQWDTYPNFQLPMFFDLARFLKRGRNCVCIRVNSRKTPVRLCAQGEVLLTTGARILLDSGPDWKAAALPRLDVAASWTHEDYNDLAWTAAASAPCPGPTYISFAPEIFSEPFRGKWIVPSRQHDERSIWLSARWYIKGHPDEAWLRVATNRQYSLYINGQKAEPPTNGPNELGTGDWIVHTSKVEGKNRAPDVMDPQDVQSLFTSQSPKDAPVSQPEHTVAPTPLLRNQEVGTFDAYSVGAMLREGENEVAVRLIQPGPLQKWTPRLALDANAVSMWGRSTLQSNAADWAAEARSADGRPESVGVIELAPAIPRLGSASRLNYLGYCYSNVRKIWQWILLGGAISLMFIAIPFLIGSRRVALLACAFGKRELGANESGFLASGTTIMAAAGLVLACTVIADASFAARNEALVFMDGRAWLIAVVASGIVALLVRMVLSAAPHSASRLFAMAKTQASRAALAAILILCAALRGYEVQYQSTHDDDWNSLQPILSIADKGVPILIEHVFYTRSPFYHYLVGGLVAVFGKNFWVFRLPSAIFAVGTAALIYFTGKTLLRSRWTGLAAATLFSLHPLLINVGHQIRFYQQQQFFALLTVYCFCRGFVEGQQMKWRYLTLAAFAGAVFSQEISVIIGLTFLPSYFLFAERKPWRDEMRFIVALVCIIIFVALDFAMFQTICLTVTDGAPPRVGPDMKLNLMFPSMFYWIFLMFSRLHLAPTVFLFLGLPFALRDSNKSLFTLYITLICGIVLSTILITSSALRFQYWLLPLYFLLLVHGMRRFSEWVMKPAAVWFHDREPVLRSALVALPVATILLSWSPWRIPGAYSTKILPDVDSALAFVRHNILPRDALAVAAPHTAAAIVEVGRVEYDIELPLLYDFVCRKNGRLLDRNAGAEVISRLDELQDACARHARMWVVLPRSSRFRSPGERIAWEEPGARFDLFVRTNLELKCQTYLADVFLWDYSKGRLKNFQRTW